MTTKIWDRKIPTVLGMILIIAGLSITTLLTQRQTIFQTGAQVSTQPQNVRITNISDSSFTISYTTKTITTGYISYGTDNLPNQTAFDEEENNQKLKNHLIHYFTINNLSPKTQYYFFIISGGDKYLVNNKNFTVTTAPTIKNNNATGSISGKIILPDSNPPQEAIVYVTTGKAKGSSVLTEKDGSYKISFANLWNQGLLSPISLTQNTELQILVLGDSLISTAKIYYKDGLDVPLITLSNNYDFRYKSTDNASSSSVFNSFPSLTSSNLVIKTNSLELLTPSSNQSFKNQKPDINGTALPHQNVKILIHSQQQIEASVAADANGNWNYQPTTDLTPGTHTITVSSKDSSGATKTITQTFAVYPLEISPTQTPLPTKNIRVTSITPVQKPLPGSGNLPIITAGIVGLLITLSGGLIFFLSRKIS